ncbi:MAG: hypothetical protein WD766_12915, partial [Gemmatimonadota bacterium]
SPGVPAIQRPPPAYPAPPPDGARSPPLKELRMQTLAILAPDLVDVTPAQRSRAQRAALEQMMLIARGHPIDSPAVRCAAALVGSAVAPDPLEYELAEVAEHEEAVPGGLTEGTELDRSPAAARSRAGSETVGWVSGSPRAGRTAEDAGPDAAWKLDERYSRYLRTIMSTQPV